MSSAAALERIASARGRRHAAGRRRIAGQLARGAGRLRRGHLGAELLHNPRVAEAALAAGVSYFDLTEDVATTRRGARRSPSRRATGQIFMPQCGLAPGFVSIVAQRSRRDWFEQLDTVQMRVGALPQFPTDELKYNLTWSTDGLINEYCNPCEAIHDGRRIERAAARRARAFLARRRALRSVQHLRRPRHAVRDARRPRPRAELQDRPLLGPPRPDEVARQRAAAGRAARACSRTSWKTRCRSRSRTWS